MRVTLLEVEGTAGRAIIAECPNGAALRLVITHPKGGAALEVWIDAPDGRDRTAQLLAEKLDAAPAGCDCTAYRLLMDLVGTEAGPGDGPPDGPERLRDRRRW